MNNKHAKVHVNPLANTDWDFGRNTSPERFVRFLCSSGQACGLQDCRKRYHEITGTEGMTLAIFFNEDRLNRNLLAPLRGAKVNYILGNYSASIALCGMLAEMLAILIHAINTPDEAEQKRFENLKQGERVARLQARKLIENRSREDFDCIRKARNSCLHRWTAPDISAEQAVKVYAAAARLIPAALDIRIENGKVILSPELYKYLEDREVL